MNQLQYSANPTGAFVRGLQKATGKEPLPIKFWDNYSEKNTYTFQNVLDKYAEYYKNLSLPQQQEAMSQLFWEQIKAIGTPIIEERLDSNQECNVYFLFPKDKLLVSTDSNPQETVKNDLYLQGDFHGYGSIDGKDGQEAQDCRQQLLEFEDTGIMMRKDSIVKNAILTYQYIQVEPNYQGTAAQPECPPFFTQNKEFEPLPTKDSEFPKISKIECEDEYSTHASPYFFPGMLEKIVRVNTDTKEAHIQGKTIDWSNLLRTTTPDSNNTNNFVYHDAFYSNKDGDLQRCEALVTEQYHDDLRSLSPPYSEFTRAIQVFKPSSGQIEDMIVINDGIPYLITGIMEHFEKMVAEKKLSPNTALVFINPLPGLETTLSKEEKNAFYQDPSAKLPGMGVRCIDYKHGIDKYTDFIANKLFPQLTDTDKGITVPDVNHRVMLGSSLSGTASIYIASKDLFGAVIAQSPSPDNRAILSTVPIEKLTGKNIQISCGEFEQSKFAAANNNLSYAEELAEHLGTEPLIRPHGHQFVSWNEELENSLPQVLHQMRRENNAVNIQSAPSTHLVSLERTESHATQEKTLAAKENIKDARARMQGMKNNYNLVQNERTNENKQVDLDTNVEHLTHTKPHMK